MGAAYRIMIVDDDPDFSEATRAVLLSQNYEVECVYDGDKALARMSEKKPDLVLLDVIMSWPLEGTSISRAMMSSPELRSIPVIMVTSIKGSEYRKVFPQDQYLHIDSWLDKPCSPQQLLAEIQAVLARHEQYVKAS